MKKLIIVIGTLFLMPTFSIAQDARGVNNRIISKAEENSKMLENPGVMMHRIENMHIYLMGFPIRHILYHTNNLIPADMDMERRELKKLQENCLYSIDRKADPNLRVSQMKFMEPFTKPAFNTGDTKVGIHPLTNAVLGTAVKDLLSTIRKGLGPENFEKAIEIPIRNSTMMKAGVNGGMIGIVVYW